MRDFLLFRKMITPLIIHFIFWVGVILCVVSAFMVIWQRNAWITGLQTLLIGPILIRIVCELLILLFRIHETLTAIKNNTAKEN